jgi:ubiquitin thioesterase OTU1
MRIRLRGPSGASTLNLGEDSTVGNLRSQISEKTLLSKFDIKYGYPPRPLLLDSNDALLSSLDVRLDGEQLTISSQEVTCAKESVGDVTGVKQVIAPAATPARPNPGLSTTVSFAGMASGKHPAIPDTSGAGSRKPVSLKRKVLDGDVPEVPLPHRGATLGK